jgi:antibiotic biosynthesis monooxygenase (ABM) superfamily enzyme
MASKPVINVVITECPPEVEGKFTKWYNEVHIPMLFKFKGMRRVTRYKLLKEPGGNPAFMAIYEFENRQDYEAYGKSPELAAARAEMQETWKGGFQITSRAQYEFLKTWQK